jgi:hypothetical protein
MSARPVSTSRGLLPVLLSLGSDRNFPHVDVSELILTRKCIRKRHPLNWTIAFEACTGHSALRLGVFHEGLPYEGGAQVFCHEHGDASVDADDVSVIPSLQWIEGIDEAVAAPRLRVMSSNVFEDTHGGHRQKRQ